MILSDRTDRNYTVRFGYENSKWCVWIGEITSTWTHPQITVRDFQAGYTAASDTFDDGWDVTFATTLGPYGKTSSDNFPASSWGKLVGTQPAPISHSHAIGDLPAYPTTLPASDVSAWAKAATQPAPIAHTHVIGDLPAYPTTLPASDVSAWAKAATQPAPIAHTHPYLLLAGNTVGTRITGDVYLGPDGSSESTRIQFQGGSYYDATLYAKSDGKLYRGSHTAAYALYDTGNKPTASDVGAYTVANTNAQIALAYEAMEWQFAAMVEDVDGTASSYPVISHSFDWDSYDYKIVFLAETNAEATTNTPYIQMDGYAGGYHTWIYERTSIDTTTNTAISSISGDAYQAGELRTGLFLDTASSGGDNTRLNMEFIIHQSEIDFVGFYTYTIQGNGSVNYSKIGGNSAYNCMAISRFTGTYVYDAGISNIEIGHYITSGTTDYWRCRIYKRARKN
mgnify:CR=1 FL=1